ncbi:MAG TPA: ABC transporter substrate-binding protein [Bacillales bacterium]|nr:ABC transporter substrate-binding protein [Bacillales bacterium]
MRKKKGMAILSLVMLVFGLALAGCSNGSGDKTASGSGGEGENSGDDQGKVTITLTGWQSNPVEQKRLKEVVAAFEEQNPNIHVEIEAIAEQYMDVLKTRLVGGEAGDVFYLDAFEAPALIQKGVIQPLDEYVTDDFDIEDFQDPLLNAFKFDGKIYGFPKDYSTLALFYNKKMFAEAGIEEPPTTFEQLRADAKKLTNGKIYGFGVAPELARLYNIGEAKGGEIIKDGKANFASDKVVSALQPIVDMHLKDKTAVVPSEVGTQNTGDAFGQGKVAMVLEGPWNIPYFKEAFPDLEYGVAEPPKFYGKKTTMAFTVAYVMNKASEHKEAAWKLISYLTGKEGMKKWTKGGIALPTRESVAKELGYENSDLRGPFVKSASYATVWQDGVNLPVVTTNFNNMFTSAFLGEQPLAKAMKKGQKQANEAIANK